MSDTGERPTEVEVTVEHSTDQAGGYRGAGSENYGGIDRPITLNSSAELYDRETDYTKFDEDGNNITTYSATEKDKLYTKIGAGLTVVAASIAVVGTAIDLDLWRVIKDVEPKKLLSHTLFVGSAASFGKYSLDTIREHTPFKTRRSSSQMLRRGFFAGGLLLGAFGASVGYDAYTSGDSAPIEESSEDSDDSTDGALAERVDQGGLTYTIIRPDQLPTFEVGESEIVSPIEDGPNPADSMGRLQWALNEAGFPTGVVSGAQRDGITNTTDQAVTDWKSANGFDVDAQFDEEMFAVLDAQVNKVLTDGNANTPNIYREAEEN